MTAQEFIQNCIDNSNLDKVIIAMIILIYWIWGRISSEECGIFLSAIGYEWNGTDHTITKDGITHKLYDMLSMACNDVYPAKAELGKFVMRIALRSAKNAGHLTAEQYTGLAAIL